MDPHGSVNDSTRTRQDDTNSGCLLAVYRRVAMIFRNLHKFAPVPAFVLAALFAIAFAAITPFPLLAQSGTWKNTGSLNTARR